MNKFNKLYDLIQLDKKDFSIEKTKKSIVNSIELVEEIKNLIIKTTNIDNGGLPRSLFIEGPTGNGKTEIVKNVAIEMGCKFHSLEIQKVPIESVIGFPYLSGNQGETDRKTLLTSPTNLPPSDSEDIWVLFLDEFNKADTEEQASFMNLILNGEIGGSSFYDKKIQKSIKYKLPNKTIVIGAGNPREQKNSSSLNSVNERDIATDERWHRRVYFNYDAESWLNNFAIKDYKFQNQIISLRVCPIITQFIYQRYLEEGSDAPFIIPKKNSSVSEESGSTFSPRAWTLASDSILEDAYNDFIFIEKDKLSFEEWFYQPEVQIEYLQKNVYEFGFYGNEIVDIMIANYLSFLQSLMPVEDLLYDCEKYKIKLKSLINKRGIISSIFNSIYNYISHHLVDVELVSESISKIIELLECSKEDLSSFVFDIISNIGNEKVALINNKLVLINKRYRETYTNFVSTNLNDLDNSLNKTKGKYS